MDISQTYHSLIFADFLWLNMNSLMSLRLFTVVILFFTKQTDADQALILSKNKIGPQDEFAILCDVKKFNQLLLPVFETVTVMKVERKLDSEENFTSIAMLFPLASELTRAQKKVPNGRHWEFDFKTTTELNNRRVIQIKVLIQDASCADVGLYRCGIFVDTSNEMFYSQPFHLRSKDTIQQGYITMIPTSMHSPFYSVNKLGDRIVLGCTLTGPEDLKVTWSYTTQDAPVRDIEYTWLDDITDYPPESALDCNACQTFFYMTTLKFKMTALANGNTYFCSASDNFSLTSRANFTVYIG